MFWDIDVLLKLRISRNLKRLCIEKKITCTSLNLCWIQTHTYITTISSTTSITTIITSITMSITSITTIITSITMSITMSITSITMSITVVLL